MHLKFFRNFFLRREHNDSSKLQYQAALLNTFDSHLASNKPLGPNYYINVSSLVEEKADLKILDKPDYKEEQPISIIIIAYNEEKYLPLLLASLENQTYKKFEVIIVDSNSTDNTTNTYNQFFIRFKEIRLVQLHCTKGPAYARNQGAKYARYNLLLFLDADTLLKKDFLKQIISELRKTNSNVATCKLRVAEKNLFSKLGAYFLNTFMSILKPIYSSAYGACLISTKEYHDKISGFREDLAVCEDCNYIKRARMSGAKFDILSPCFYTSDRRAKKEGSIKLLLKYFRIHLSRMLFQKEIMNDEMNYTYGGF